jgi:hypothetical protein
MNFKSGKIPEDALATLFSTALDWTRYAPNCWILWSTTSPEEWYKFIKKEIAESDHFFIVELDISKRQGWLPKAVWNWIKTERT